MSRDVDKRLEKIKGAIDKMVKKAEEDGIITDNEAKIIESAKNVLNEYKEMVTKAKEDNVITQDELNTLIDLEEKLISESYFEAMDDEDLDKDEMTLLKTLILSMDPNASVSWLYHD